MKNKFFLLFLLAPYLSSGQTDFFYTGTVQTYTVPIGVTIISVDAQGAVGGGEVGFGYTTTGGNGGRVQCNLSVTPGQVLYIFVGSAGGPYPPGFGGGGSGSEHLIGGGGYVATGSGGGATDIRIGGTDLANRVIVAGAGGGSSCYFNSYISRGGDGGGLTGENGWYNNSDTTGEGGYGGSQTMGGDAGVNPGYLSGTPGALGVGGNGGAEPAIDTEDFCEDGGGGGGGYYGGGGGARSGGGGGSSYTDPALTSNVVHTRGYNSNGNGLLAISMPTSTPAMPSNILFAIYPNPTQSELTITSPNTISSITISNLLGQTVYNKSLSAQLVQIDVKHLPKGLYFVKINGSEVVKFVKE
jgi:hypothetical protein